jgi:hypothetical protein
MSTLERGANKGLVVGAMAGLVCGPLLYLFVHEEFLPWVTGHLKRLTWSAADLSLLAVLGAVPGAGFGAAVGTLAGLWSAHHYRTYDPNRPGVPAADRRVGMFCAAALGAAGGLIAGSMAGMALWRIGGFNDGATLGTVHPILEREPWLAWGAWGGLAGLIIGAILVGRAGARSDRRAAAIAVHSIVLDDTAERLD